MTNAIEMSRRHHEAMVGKGFWINYEGPEYGPERDAQVAQKFALIHTEIVELSDAIDEPSTPIAGWTEKVLEEAADVCLRMLDSCAGLGIEPAEDCLTYGYCPFPDEKGLLLLLHRRVARATQVHRKRGDMREEWVRTWLGGSMRAIAGYATRITSDREALARAMEKKMEKNAERPHLHGVAY